MIGKVYEQMGVALAQLRDQPLQNIFRVEIYGLQLVLLLLILSELLLVKQILDLLLVATQDIDSFQNRTFIVFLDQLLNFLSLRFYQSLERLVIVECPLFLLLEAETLLLSFDFEIAQAFDFGSCACEGF